MIKPQIKDKTTITKFTLKAVMKEVSFVLNCLETIIKASEPTTRRIKSLTMVYQTEAGAIAPIGLIGIA